MVDVKRLLSPKVIFPVVGICVLLVVAVLVAVFYVRNPTVTENLFNPAESTTPSADDVDEKEVSLIPRFQTTMPPYTGNNGTLGSYGIERKSTVPPHELQPTETTFLLHTLASSTPMPSSGTVEPRAVEPVSHD